MDSISTPHAVLVVIAQVRPVAAPHSSIETGTSMFGRHLILPSHICANHCAHRQARANTDIARLQRAAVREVNPTPSTLKSSTLNPHP